MSLAGAERAALAPLSFLRALVSGAPLTEWFTSADIYSLTGLEAGSPKPECCQGHAPSEDSRRIPSGSLPAAGGGQPSAAFLGLQPHHSALSASVVLWHPPSVHPCLCVQISLSLEGHQSR